MPIPVQAVKAITPSRAGLRWDVPFKSFPAAAFVVWQAILGLTWIGATDYWSQIELIASGSTSRSQMVGFVIYVVAAGVAISLFPGASIGGIIKDVPSLVLLCLLASQAVTAPWSIDPFGSLQYAIAFLMALFALRAIWLLDPISLGRWLATAGFVILVCLCILTWQLGVNDRFIGGIRPNTIGAMAFAAAWLALAGGGYLSPVTVGGALVFIYISNSRIFMLCLLIMILAYTICRMDLYKRTVVLASCALCLTVAMLVDFSTGERMTEFFVQEVARVNDPDRGIESGGTGRVQRWSKGLELVPESPIVGFGFKTRGENDAFLAVDQAREKVNAHAGLINLALDSGFIGVVLLLVALVLRVVGLAVLIKEFRHGAGRRLTPSSEAAYGHAACSRIAAAGIGGMLAYALHLVIEPTYLNLGNSFIVVALMFLSGQPQIGRADRGRGTRASD